LQKADVSPRVFGEMPEHVARDVVEGMHEGGIDFAVFLPESEFKTAQLAVARDPRFQSVIVSSETIGIPICGGAWAGGKRPAMMMGASGMPLTCYPLTWLGNGHNMPMLLLITTRTFGDEHYIYGVATKVIEPLLEGMGIPVRKVRRSDEVRRVIADAARTCFVWLRPIAVILSEEVIDNRPGGGLAEAVK